MDFIPENDTVLRGQVIKIRQARAGGHSSEPPETGTTWYLFDFRAEESGETIAVKGNAFDLFKNIRIEIIGQVEQHAKFGPTFAAKSIIQLPPSDLSALRKYLKEFDGVGKTTAQAMVDRFGTEIANILDNHPEKLKEIRGFAESRRRRFITQWRERSADRLIMEQLAVEHRIRVTPQAARRIERRWGGEAMGQIRANPYSLIGLADNFAFGSADNMAAILGITAGSEFRVKAGLREVMRQSENRGNSWLPAYALIEQTGRLFEAAGRPVPANEITAIIDRLSIPAVKLIAEDRRRNRAWLKSGDHDHPPELRVLAGIGNWLAEYETLLEEYDLARELVKLATSRTGWTLAPPDDTSNRATAEGMINPTLEQRRALEILGGNNPDQTETRSRLAVLSGGPGTGKTTMTRALVEQADRQELNVLLASPTGKASNRLTEAMRGLNYNASTIHRLLSGRAVVKNWDDLDFYFKHNRANPLECDLLIVDEVSMISNSLMLDLLRAVPGNARIILVGDTDQLQSIEAGAVLHQVIASGAFPVARLTEIHRQVADSAIIRAARAVAEGLPPLETGEGFDFQAIPGASGGETYETIVQGTILAKVIHFMAIGVDPDDIQVLAPIHASQAGVTALNEVLKPIFNPSSAGLLSVSITINGRVFHCGDRVMQTGRNDYENKIFNGDQGIVTAIDLGSRAIEIWWDGDRKTILKGRDGAGLEHAYAITVHKAQGSEFSHVIMPIVPAFRRNMNRSLLYTGITRGKEQVSLIGDPVVLGEIAARPAPDRYTCLARMIQKGIEAAAQAKSVATATIPANSPIGPVAA